MDFEWSETKRLAVLRDRQIDFIDVQALFDGRPLCTVPSLRGDEQRWLSVGELNERFVAVVWTWRGAAIRIITARRARDGEKRRYRALYG